MRAFEPSDRLLVFAHRGGPRLRPENTVEAFTHGLACGADGIECDVRLSRDGVPVVIHDATLERTTDRSEAVESQTVTELQRADAAYRFAPEAGYPFRGRGVQIPTLEDVLETSPSALVIVELKDETPTLARRVVETIRRCHAEDRTCVGSFFDAGLRELRRLGPEIATSASRKEAALAVRVATLMLSWPFAAYRALQLPMTSADRQVISPRLIQACHRRNRSIQAWTIDDPEEMTLLRDWGIDGVISDVPDVAVRTIRG